MIPRQIIPLVEAERRGSDREKEIPGERDRRQNNARIRADNAHVMRDISLSAKSRLPSAQSGFRADAGPSRLITTARYRSPTAIDADLFISI